MYIDFYERNYSTLQEAQQAAQITGGTLTTFISTDEHGQPVTIYSVKYKPLF